MVLIDWQVHEFWGAGYFSFRILKSHHLGFHKKVWSPIRPNMDNVEENWKSDENSVYHIMVWCMVLEPFNTNKVRKIL